MVTELFSNDSKDLLQWNRMKCNSAFYGTLLIPSHWLLHMILSWYWRFHLCCCSNRLLRFPLQISYLHWLFWYEKMFWLLEIFFAYEILTYSIFIQTDSAQLCCVGCRWYCVLLFLRSVLLLSMWLELLCIILMRNNSSATRQFFYILSIFPFCNHFKRKNAYTFLYSGRISK